MNLRYTLWVAEIDDHTRGNRCNKRATAASDFGGNRGGNLEEGGTIQKNYSVVYGVPIGYNTAGRHRFLAVSCQYRGGGGLNTRNEISHLVVVVVVSKHCGRRNCKESPYLSETVRVSYYW